MEGKQHEIVQIIAFANFGKKSQDTFIEFFSLVLNNVIINFIPLLSAHDFQTFILFFFCIFVYCFFSKLQISISFPEIFGNLAAIFFLKHNCVHCCNGNLVIPSIFCITVTQE